VKVISDPMGVPLSEPRTVDLAARDRTSGKPLHSIIKTTDPERYGVKVSDYLI